MLDVKSGKRAFTAFAVALIAAGCGGTGGGAAPAEPAFDGDLSTVLTVEIKNDQQNDARITLWINRNSDRIGTVRAFSTRTFHIPLSVVSEIHMEFDLTMGSHCITAPLSLGPGEEITVVIPSNLNMMVARCRND